MTSCCFSVSMGRSRSREPMLRVRECIYNTRRVAYARSKKMNKHDKLKKKRGKKKVLVFLTWTLPPFVSWGKTHGDSKKIKRNMKRASRNKKMPGPTPS